MCGGTRGGLAGGGLAVSVTNPVAWARDEWVRVEVPPGAYRVRDPGGAAVPAQTTPLNNGNATLLWLAEGLAPMGTARFTVARAAGGAGGGASVAATVAPLPAGGTSLENEHLRVAFGGDGRIARITQKATGQALAVSADILYYHGAAKGQGDDAYDFASNGTQAHPFPSDMQVQALCITGPLYSEVCLFSNAASNIELRVSLSPGDQHVAIDAGVGPVDIVSDNVSKDVVLRVNASIESGSYWYTDSQGMELMRRTRGNGTFNQTLGLTPGKNYYPTTAMAAIRDASAQLVLLNDRSEGASSMGSGSLEVMVYRRIKNAGSKGLGDNNALNHNSTVNTTHWLLAGPPADTSALMRPLAVRMYNPLLLTVAPAGGASPPAVPPALAQPLRRALPPNVQLLNLQTLSSNFTVSCGPKCDIACPRKNQSNPAPPPPDPSALPTGAVLLRLAHIYAVGEGGGLARPATVDLATMFSTLQVKSVTEYTLSALQPLAQMKRLRWAPGNVTAAGGAAAGTAVTLGPMDIRTFIVTLA